MSAPRTRVARSRPATTTNRFRTGAIAPALVALALLSACGDAGEPTAEVAPTTDASSSTSVTTTTPTVPSTSTTTTKRTTTSAAASTSTTTKRTTTTTRRTTTTTTEPLTTIALEHADPIDVQETEPIAPPLDAYAAEPVIEMGTLAIPKLGVEMTMFEGIRLTTLDYGPGHWPGTALPGQIGNVVVGGHRTSKHRVFRHVDQLVAGDEIIFADEAGSHTYIVDRVEIIEPTDVWIVNPTATPTATLFACHPPGSTAQRIAVFADLAE